MLTIIADFNKSIQEMLTDTKAHSTDFQRAKVLKKIKSKSKRRNKKPNENINADEFI